MAKFARVTLPEWHSGQHHVFNNQKRRNFICAHRGWYKTSFCMSLAVNAMLRGTSSRWWAPTMIPINDAINEHFMKALPRELLNQHKTEQYIEMNGNRVQFYSLMSDENSRGPSATLGFGDEWGLVREDVYESVVDPILMKSNGTGWFFGTYNDTDPFNHFYKMINEIAPTRPDYIQALTIPVSAKVNSQGDLEPMESPLANPALKYPDLENSFYTAPNKTKWRIEWLCEALSLDGAVFTNIHKACCLQAITPEPIESHEYIICADIGKVRDYTVIIAFDMTTKHMVYMDRFTDCSWEQIYSRLSKASARYGGRPIKVDATGAGSHIAEEMLRRGVYVIEHKWNITNKPKLIDHLASLIESGQLYLWQNRDIIQELKEYRQKTMEGKIKYLSNIHDDIVTTLAMCAEPMQIKQGDSDDGSAILDRILDSKINKSDNLATVQW